MSNEEFARALYVRVRAIRDELQAARDSIAQIRAALPDDATTSEKSAP